MRRLRHNVVLTALFLAIAADATAQSLYGSLVGNVTDETGGASRRDRHRHADRDEPVARCRDQRDRQLQRPQPAARHLRGRRQAAGISDLHARATSPCDRASTSASTRD